MQGRRFGSLLPTLVLSWAVMSSPAIAFPGPDSPGSALDYQAVRAHYDNGDFDRVAQSLETFLARNPVHSHDDSVFVAKHLAVVYSSNESTVERGRQYMYRLVDLLPSSRLVDMYVQDERSRIFRKVREQFLARQHAMGVDTAGIVLPDSRVPVAPAGSGPGHGIVPGLRQDAARPDRLPDLQAAFIGSRASRRHAGPGEPAPIAGRSRDPG